MAKRKLQQPKRPNRAGEFRVTYPGKRNARKAKADLELAILAESSRRHQMIVVVDACRAAGMSWREIGECFGITASAACQRYRRYVRY